MTGFVIRFFICSVFIALMVGIILAARRIYERLLPARMRYHLWFLLLILLAVPFLPIQLPGFLQIFAKFAQQHISSASGTETILQAVSDQGLRDSSRWMNDFTLSVHNGASSAADFVLLSVWLLGTLAMCILTVKSGIRLHRFKQSALPLQNRKVQKLYFECLQEMGIDKNIPIYSTAFLKSPIMTGLFFPRIYLPIHLISDCNARDVRYILLHELQHYRHKDTLANYFMNLAGILYWFHPFVWFALKEMRNDREIACDSSVLEMLDETDYEAYGTTLINFARKISLTPFPFTAGMGGSMKQMKRRILNIASYEALSPGKKRRGMAAFCITALLLFSLAPALSVSAARESHGASETQTEAACTDLDLSSYFTGYDGSFVLYDLEKDRWKIYNQDSAVKRSSPDSTYKIYDALFGLELGVITPEDSQIAWNQERYPFESWNTDQNLRSAMQNSVNWYFQSLDAQIGLENLKRELQHVGYGNEDLGMDTDSYWLESSLQISPLEQVELLTDLYCNRFGYARKNIEAVKDAIRLSSSAKGTLYGKTGTGRVDSQNVNGWFVGFVEGSGHTYFFAANIHADKDAAGSNAAKIALSVLADLNIWSE